MSENKQDKPELDHPDQAIDTPLPDDDVKDDVFAAMQAEYEGDPEEVDGHVGKKSS